MIDDVPTLSRWASTFRRLADVDPVRCAGYLASAQHLERAVDAAAHQPAESDQDDVAPGRWRVRLPARAGAR